MALEGTALPADAAIITHGCGKTHPIDATSAADEGNRRVEVFLFDGPVDPAPTQPCPLTGCTQYPITARLFRCYSSGKPPVLPGAFLLSVVASP
jgi:hypothetical protein